MELNWKEDNNLIRKLAKILLGDTLPNGEPVNSFLLLDDASRAELQRWANMSDAEFAAAQRSGDSIRMDVEDVIRKKNMPLTHSCSMICFRFLMQMIWNFLKKSVNGKILAMTSQRNISSPILIPISSPNRCRLTAPDTISGLTRLDISV